MKSQIAFLLSGVAGIAAMSAAQAAPVASPSAVRAPQSYSELLEPVQNATATLIADDLAKMQQQKPPLHLVQYHHHHHHSFYHHHHHHHHHAFFPGFGIAVAPPVYGAPDCYIRRRVYINSWGERVIRRVRVCDY